MMSWLLTYATSSLVLISRWRFIGATHLGQQGTSVVRLPHRRDGLSALLMAVLLHERHDECGAGGLDNMEQV